MVYLSTSDMFEAHCSSLIADYDRITMVNLYQPIIGYAALALYFTLVNEADNQKITSIATHERLLLRMKMSSGEFVESRKSLEGMGLLKTYLTQQGGIKFYRYELYAPKTPNQFFEDSLLFGTLISYIGETEANKLRSLYQKEESVSEGENISASFGEVYHTSLPEQFLASQKKSRTQGRKNAKIDTEFSYEKFFESVKKISQFNENSFRKEEMKEIERLATLYGAKEEDAAQAAISHYVPGEGFDLAEINHYLQNMGNYFFLGKKEESSSSNVNSDTALGKKIKLFESVSPKEFLSMLQNGTKPASSDLNLIDSLSADFRLKNAVINVIVDFVLQRNNNVLSRKYCEKIAASLARENIQNPVDAMNYLLKTSTYAHKYNENPKGNTSSKENNVSGKETDKNVSDASASETLSKEEEEAWDKMIQEMEKDS